MMKKLKGLNTIQKRVQPGDLFICLTGEHVDGHEYAEEALANGAIACVVEIRLSIEAPQIVVPSTEEMIAKISSELLLILPENLISLVLQEQMVKLQ